MARLDERLAKSPIRAGFVVRTHFTDAAACLWLDGELVHLDDLVLHDAYMDIRAPTHELTRAHAVLRTRSRIADAKPDWALSPAGLASLRGRGEKGDREGGRGNRKEGKGHVVGDDEDGDQAEADLDAPLDVVETDPHLAAAFAAVDAANARAERTLAGGSRPHLGRDPLVYDPDWDEDARLGDWRAVVEQTRTLPPTLATTIAAEAWTPSRRCSTRPGSAACLPPRCCANTARPVGTCRACMPG